MIITIIEENIILSNILSRKIIKSWYNTKIINNCDDFLKNNYINSDLFIIGNFNKEKWNCDLIKFIRKNSFTNSPIIILWSHNDPIKIINNFDLWADDYLSSPFSYDELIARVRAIIRRSYKVSQNSKIIYKNINYDVTEKIIRKKWKDITLTSRELQLTEFLLYNIWKLITKTQLINSVWWEYDLLRITDNNINVTISNIRRKLWEDFKFKTLVNKWYILER
jgi:two-component system phosphate regulon response regulator PhoB